MKQPLIQIYEIQEPREAEALIELAVDHIGSVLLNPEGWKVPAVRDVVRLIGQSSAKSSLIPLFRSADDILRALDYYSPAFVHFCELIPLGPRAQKQREDLCTELIRIQQLVKKEFPPIGIIRSIPLPVPGSTEPEQAKEAILAIARRLAPHSDFFMTDTLRGSEPETAVQPVAGYVGITGEVCDWALAAALIEAAEIPLILAGGIGPENVREAIARVKPAGIDSCTQTNARDGRGKPIRFKKDLGLVRRLIEEVRHAEADMPPERREP